MPNWIAESPSTVATLPPVPDRGDLSGRIRAYTALIALETLVIFVCPWIRIHFAAVHGHLASWTVDFPRSIFHAILVSLFAVVGLLLFLNTSRLLERRIAVAPAEDEVRFLDRTRSDLALLTHILLFVAMLLSVS